MLLPPHAETGTTMQAVPSDALEWLRYAGAAVIGALAAFIGFRTRLYGIDRDIRDLREKQRIDHEELKRTLGERFDQLTKAIADGHNDRTLAKQRADGDTREALNAIRRDNDVHHTENSRRLNVMREQMLVLLRLVAKVTRAVPGIAQNEVDEAMGKFLSLEVAERAD